MWASAPEDSCNKKVAFSFALGYYATWRLRSMSDRIEKQVEIQAPVPRVWRALTDHNEFGQWFGVKLDGPFVPGQNATGKIIEPKYAHLKWTMLIQRIEPEHLFSFTWHPYALDPNTDYSKETPTLVEFKLEKTSKGTLLRVTESGFDKIPAARRAEAFLRNDNGWATQMKNIEAYVAKNP
jgi:uncharacterized protein YndB with AHSA1/START domain